MLPASSHTHPTSLPTTTDPCNHQSVQHLYNHVILATLYKWNYTKLHRVIPLRPIQVVALSILCSFLLLSSSPWCRRPQYGFLDCSSHLLSDSSVDSGSWLLQWNCCKQVCRFLYGYEFSFHGLIIQWVYVSFVKRVRFFPRMSVFPPAMYERHGLPTPLPTFSVVAIFYPSRCDRHVIIAHCGLSFYFPGPWWRGTPSPGLICHVYIPLWLNVSSCLLRIF